jgi:4-amino-4-deoxy-L-arabinose transferase-like glycosyltransferase
VQWLSMCASLVGVSLIAGQLGALRLGQIFAALVAACVPMGLLQAVSTQTDYVETFWLICCVFFLIRAARQFSFVGIVAAGLSLGLAVLTKGNSYIFILPFLIWFFCFVRRWSAVMILVVCFLAINAGQYQRNIQAFGSIGWTHVAMSNGSFGPNVLAANILRNTATHLATPSQDVNTQIARRLTGAAHIFGININEPAASFTSEPFTISKIMFDEDADGNFIHIIFFVAAFILFLFLPSKTRGLRFYALCVCSAAILFCWILRYQPWHSRFHLPLFILFCPLFAVLVQNIFKPRWICGMAVVFFCAALPWLFLNKQHPWRGPVSIWKISKPLQYFYKKPDMAVHFSSVAAQLVAHHCRNIGLMLGEDSWEYPLWAMLRLYEPHGTRRIEHVGVNNQSAHLKYPLGDFIPDALVMFGRDTEQISLPDGRYRRAWLLETRDGLSSSIYVPDSSISSP